MYNRYIPQPDGTYRRKRIEDPTPPPKAVPPPDPPQEEHIKACPPPEYPKQQTCQTSSGSFLRQLLPREFDTGDLIVIALLLLIAGDCETERSNALLTLALYFSM